jgi:hypothetical protein
VEVPKILADFIFFLEKDIIKEKFFGFWISRESSGRIVYNLNITKSKRKILCFLFYQSWFY